jgi:hypothetical protein
MLAVRASEVDGHAGDLSESLCGRGKGNPGRLRKPAWPCRGGGWASGLSLVGIFFDLIQGSPRRIPNLHGRA